MVWCASIFSTVEIMPVLDPIYSLIVTILVAFVFAHAATHKAMDYTRHVAIVADYQVMPAQFVPLLAPLVIVLEFAAAILVLLTATRPMGLILAAGLLLAYLFSIGLNLLRGRTSIDCGCGWGSQEHPISGWLLIRNLLFVAVILSALLPLANRSLHLADWILVVLASSAVIAIYYIGDLLIANWLKLRKLKSV
jgi:uncharacterized membrane protein YphA (DoxX/SURF4 family)